VGVEKTNEFFCTWFLNVSFFSSVKISIYIPHEHSAGRKKLRPLTMSNVPANSSVANCANNVGSPSYSHGYPQGSAQCLVVEQDAVAPAVPLSTVLVDGGRGDKQRCAVGTNYAPVGSALVSPSTSAPASVGGGTTSGDLRSIIQ